MKKYGLFHEQLVTDGKKVWYIEFTSKLLMEMDIASCEVSVIGEIPGLDCYNDAYRFFVYVNHKLIFLPFNSNNFLEYDLIERKFSKFIIKSDVIYNRLQLFSGVVFGDYIYAFGKMPFILKLNYKTGDIELDDSCKEMVPNSDKITAWFNRDFCVYDKHIYLLVYGRHIIFDYDMNSEAFACISFETEAPEFQLSGICFDGKMFWLTSRNANRKVELFTLNPNPQKICRIDNVTGLGLAGDQDLPYFLRLFNNRVYFIPCNVGNPSECLIYDMEKHDLYSKSVFGVQDSFIEGLHRLNGPYLYNDYYSSVADYVECEIIMINPWCGKRIIWNLLTGDTVSDDISVNKDAENSIIKKVMDKKTFFECEMPLDIFMTAI